MLKSEFCLLIEVDPETFPENKFEIINAVYMEHPAIQDVDGKQQIANIYKFGGMHVINDMFRHVASSRILRSRIINVEERIKEVEERRDKAIEAVYADFKTELDKLQIEHKDLKADFEELKGGK